MRDTKASLGVGSLSPLALRRITALGIALLLGACSSGGDGAQPAAAAEPSAEDRPAPSIASTVQTFDPFALAQAEPIAAAISSDNLRTCGNEGETACGLGERDSWNNACDTALTPKIQTCGCKLVGPFGGCLVTQLCTVCVNETRRRASIDAFKNSWADWALTNQRDSLAVDEPINWVMRLGTHNSFNSVSDGHRPVAGDGVGNFVDAPNQFYTITDQLRAGARVLSLDVHLVHSRARLCHGGQVSPEKGPFANRDVQLCLLPQAVEPFFPGMRYYANGIKEIRNWLASNPNQILIFETENRVGGGCDTCSKTDTAPGLDPLRKYLSAEIFAADDAGAPDADGTWPSRRQLLERRQRVIILDQQQRDESLTFHEAEVLSDANVFADAQRYYPDCKATYVNDEGETFVGGPTAAERGEFTAVFEDRTLLAPFTKVGSLDVNEVRAAADCNYSVIALDFFASQIPAGRNSDFTNFSRQEAAVWSWKFGDRGQNGDCAKLEFGSGRWVSAACGEVHRFACAPPRSESGNDARQWEMLEDDWHVTNHADTWSMGQTICAAEYPGYVFSVPVNGFQSRVLFSAGVAAGVSPGDLWLNYTDQQKEGSWIIPRLATSNAHPIADAGPDRMLECGNALALDGSGSSDPDGDALSYTWRGSFGSLVGRQVDVALAPGTHVITLTVDDGRGGSDTDQIEATVADTTAPTMSVTLAPASLWPPNHELITVAADVRVTDACGDDDVQISLESITSNEPDEANGQPHSPDIVGAEPGIGDLEFELRAERLGGGAGRVYKVKYRAEDSAGNAAASCAYATVPHDASGRPPALEQCQ